jgi:hypothetical protein
LPARGRAVAFISLTVAIAVPSRASKIAYAAMEKAAPRGHPSAAGRQCGATDWAGL